MPLSGGVVSMTTAAEDDVDTSPTEFCTHKFRMFGFPVENKL